jgi:hypothetical protein
MEGGTVTKLLGSSAVAIALVVRLLRSSSSPRAMPMMTASSMRRN